jgi:hypothetical protein
LEDIPALALLVVLQLLLDHANDDVIADQAARIHDLLSLPAEGGLLGDLGSQHVSRRLVVAKGKWSAVTWQQLWDRISSRLAYQVTAMELLLDLGCLRPLAYVV